jgi:pimeloyl-ACP methyl ester carboxylesterase
MAMTVSEQIRRDKGNPSPSEHPRPRSPSGEPRVPRRRRIKRVVLIALGMLGLILLGVFVVAFALFRQDLREARSRLASIPTTTYKSQYGDIQFRIAGSGPSVLVSHGITGGVDQAEYLVTRWGILDQRYRFVYVSRFGYLDSSLPEDATPRVQAAAYRALLDHLGIERVFVVGNSAGGASAMWFAIDYPERTNGLILVSSAVPGPEPDPIPKLVREHDFIYWSAIKVAPDMLIGLLLPKEVRGTLTEAEKDFIVENAYMAGLPISERAEGIVFDNEQSNPGVNEVPFERIETPTLIFQAIDDPRELRGGREMARRIPNSEFIGLTGGHFLLRHEDEIRVASAEFIARHSSEGD